MHACPGRQLDRIPAQPLGAGRPRGGRPYHGRAVGYPPPTTSLDPALGKAKRQAALDEDEGAAGLGAQVDGEG
jgi:hypothetical protein